MRQKSESALHKNEVGGPGRIISERKHRLGMPGRRKRMIRKKQEGTDRMITEEKENEKTEKAVRAEKSGGKHIKTAAGLAGLAAAPFISYVLFEFVTGNLTAIPLKMALLNIWWFALFYLAVFVLSGSSRITMAVSSVLMYGISLAEAFVVSFRGRPIMLTEVLAVRTALSVAGNYTFHVSKVMAAAGAAVVLMNLIFWFFPVRLKGLKVRLLTAVIGLAAVWGGARLFFDQMVPRMGLAVNLWYLEESYGTNGFVLSSAVSLQYMVKEPPAGYSEGKVKEIVQKVQERSDENESQPAAENVETTEAIQPVNLICIMNESLSELKMAGDYETNTSYFPFMDNLSENTVKGSLCVPVFGSLTSNTEFEFLTGDSMALLPANCIAYQFFVRPGILSLVSTLKAQGYRALAMHPYPGENWNRNACYKNMGFDEFWDEEMYEDSGQLRLYVSDRADYDKIIEAVDQKENPEDRLFIFNVTMQNHGGYDILFDSFRQEVRLTGDLEGKYPKTDQYLSLMLESDRAFEYLVEHFEQSDEPTMIVIFGDHQPGVEDEFYDEIRGTPSSQISGADRMIWYQTPFYIWTNYEMPSKDMGMLGSVFLGSEVLNLANLELTPYDSLRLKLAEEVPVVHFLGCWDKNGTFYSWEDAEKGQEFSELLLDYERLVYNHSLDNKTVSEAFSVPQE